SAIAPEEERFLSVAEFRHGKISAFYLRFYLPSSFEKTQFRLDIVSRFGCPYLVGGNTAGAASGNQTWRAEV
ncbi:hypothetical protein P7K49_040883, partial [Saguinus oedipus]